MSDRSPNKISQGRQLAYYGGKGLAIIGLLVFLSSFADLACGSGNSGGFSSEEPSQVFFSEGVRQAHDRFDSGFKRAIVGMILMIAGAAVSKVGARGLAGSGVILDPEQAREDLKPWSKMAGGIVDDALSEVKPLQKMVEHLTEEHAAPPEPPQAIKVRCRECHALNDEDARFCDQCGAEL